MKNIDGKFEELLKRGPKKKHNPREIAQILKKLGNPHLAYPTIHIAGTNGKGQVSLKIARALQKGGNKVGLFISPHVFRFEERISINEKTITLDQISAYDETLPIKLDFFEWIMVIGFLHFQKECVDVAVIEVGLGGRLDPTVVIQPILSVITSISKDHTHLLGETLNEIASEKGGIIKSNTPIVVGPHANFSSIFEKAEQVKAPIHLVETHSPLYDLENQAIACKSLEVICSQFPLKEKEIEEGLQSMQLCRMQRQGKALFDVAHNPDGFERLIGALEHLYPDRKFRFVIGMSDRKDLENCLKSVVKKAMHIHFVDGQFRCASVHYLKEVLNQVAPGFPCTIEQSISEGVKNAEAATAKEDLFVVCGSFYIMDHAFHP